MTWLTFELEDGVSPTEVSRTLIRTNVVIVSLSKSEYPDRMELLYTR